MTQMLDLLRARRSIRKYADEPLTAAQVEALAEALLRSPTSRNLEPWTFVFVDDRELLRDLARCKPHGAASLAEAALGIVVCGDETRSDVWVEDCSIASIVVQLAAQSLGLGSCWVQVRRRMHDDTTTAESSIQELLDIPPHQRVESVIAVGHPAQPREARPASDLNRGKIRRNGWSGR